MNGLGFKMCFKLKIVNNNKYLLDTHIGKKPLYIIITSINALILEESS